MKKKILLTTGFIIYIQIGAICQIISGDFSGFSFTGTGGCKANYGPNYTFDASPFNACSFNGWVVSHGSPEIWMNGTNPCASMWSGKWVEPQLKSEGIHAYCYFQKDKLYHLTLKIACAPYVSASSGVIIQSFIDNVFVKLANNVPIKATPEWGVPPSSNYIIPTVTQQQTLLNEADFTSTSWVYRDIYFIPDMDYNSLWIYPYYDPEYYEGSGMGTISVLFVDDVVIEDCIPDITYSNNTSLPAVTMRGNYIRAINNTQVLNGQDVKFIAGDYISLEPNFYANSGSTFHAFISECDQLTCTNPEKSIPLNQSVSDEFNSMSVFPNPHTGVFNITIESALNISPNLYIIDLSGRILYTQSVALHEGQNRLEITRPELPSGIYFIKIDGFDEPVKMIISK